MKSDIIRDLIRLRFEVANTMAEYLPSQLKSIVFEAQKDFSDIAGEYAAAHENTKEASKNIPIS